MPTIEIISIDSPGLGIQQASFEVAIIEENELMSHRSIFFDFLRKHKGTIVHIGNPGMKDHKEYGFFAGQIIDWEFENAEIFIPTVGLDDRTSGTGANQQTKFKFLNRYRSDIDRLLKLALAKSPVKRIFFLTDCQFGPDRGCMENLRTIGDLWIIHDYKGLAFNTLYEVCETQIGCP